MDAWSPNDEGYPFAGMTSADTWKWDVEARNSDARAIGLSDGKAAAEAGQPASSREPWHDERYDASYRGGWEQGYAAITATRARHCEQAQAGYFYCEAAEGDPCGPGRHPHAGHAPGQCAVLAG